MTLNNFEWQRDESFSLTTADHCSAVSKFSQLHGRIKISRQRDAVLLACLRVQYLHCVHGRINHSGAPYQRKAGPISHTHARILSVSGCGVHFSSLKKLMTFFSRRYVLERTFKCQHTAWEKFGS